MKGSRLGKYEILRRLASGGMAEIFLARMSGLSGFQKMFVIKRILPQLATKADFVEMFLDEARIAATLQHPNVVQMYEVGVVDRNYFIAMEYLHGEDLRSLQKTLWSREDKIPLEISLGIVLGVAAGLHYAHEKVGFDGVPLEIVHRDVTPQNVIVTYDGNVKLLDFGIAKATNRFGETRFGTLKGKVPHMSPEQCRGEPLDRRSDIFALGIMLYELTVGRRLYKGASDFEVLKQIVEGRVPLPSELDPGYDRQLEAIVMRALEKDRDQRYPTVRDMQQELEELALEARLRITATHMQHFMHRVFGHKIEAWEDAQSKGKTLDEHLEVADVDEDDVLEELDGKQAAAEARAARERAALKAALDIGSVRFGVAAPYDGAFAHDPAPQPLSGETRSDLARPRTRSPRVPLLVASVIVLVLSGLAGWKVMHRPSGPSAPASPVPSEKGAAASPGAAGQAPAVGTTTPAVGAAAPARATSVSSPGARESGKSKHRASHARHEAPKNSSEPAAPPPQARGEGKLVLASSPWVDVSVDGESKGQTPLAFKLAAGVHKLVLVNPEYHVNRTITVTIQAGETVRKRFDFPQ